MSTRNTISLVLLTALTLASRPAWSGEESPAQGRIAAAKHVIQDNPTRVDGYNRLAMALAERARETADPSYYDQSHNVLKQSFAIESDNYGGMKVKTWVLLGQHRFAEALDHAVVLNTQVPDDLIVYSLLTDANVELGNYEDAEKACQWMLNMRPGNVPGLTRGAYLRELWGDVDGAIELMQMALGKTPSHETETVAWLETHIAHLFLMTGQLAEAEHFLDLALAAFPNYHYALANQAELRTAQGRHEDALVLSRKHYEVAPHPENLYLVGQALMRSGREVEAKSAFERFVQAALAESENLDNANRQLIAYYAIEGGEPSAALRLAQLEIEHRKDIYAWEAYALALHANGKSAEAREAIDRALRLDIKDAKLLYRAGVIAIAQGEQADARSFFERAIRVNAPSTWAADARTQLQQLASTDLNSKG